MALHHGSWAVEYIETTSFVIMSFILTSRLLIISARFYRVVFHKHFLRTKLSLHTVSDLIFNSVTKFQILLSPTLTYQRQKSTFILSANQKPHITVPPPGFHAAPPVRERVHAPGISQESSEKGGGQEDALQRLHHERLVSPPSTFHFFWPSYQTSITAFL